MFDWTGPFPESMLNPWRTNPGLGVGILLKPSGLLVVDCDSQAAVEEAIENTPERCRNVVMSRQGCHMYYQRPEGCKALRAIKRGVSGKIDILAAGLMVAPPSVHHSGHLYQWASWGELQEAPDWAAGMLAALTERSIAKIIMDPADVLGARKVEDDWPSVRAAYPKVWHLLSGKEAPTDRSTALWLCVNTLIRLGYDDAAIARVIWFGPMGAKPHEKGWAWFCDEIARARCELLPS